MRRKRHRGDHGRTAEADRAQSRHFTPAGVHDCVQALPGAILGTLAAWLLFNGLAASPYGFSFQLAVTPPLAVIGVEWALVMGLFGGLLPAVRAARMPITTALRAT